MKKKSISICLAAIAVSLLCGCASVNVNVKTKGSENTDNTENTESTEGTDSADNTDDLADFPQLTSEDYDLSKFDGDVKYFDSHGNAWSLTDDSAKKYPELAKALEKLDNDQKKDFEDTISEYDDEAKQYADENKNDENFYCYAYYADTGLACADPKVVSLVSTYFSSLGGAHPSTYTVTYNLDSETGKDISLVDVISDKNGLDEMLKEILIEQYGDHAFFGLNESFDSMALEDYIFSFAPDGLTFYFNPADLSPRVDDGEQVYLTYEKLANVLEDKYK